MTCGNLAAPRGHRALSTFPSATFENPGDRAKPDVGTWSEFRLFIV